MGYRVEVSDEAKQDLDEIVRYIAEDLGNPIAAKRFLDTVDKCYDDISDNPFFAFCLDERLQKAGYRKVIINNYLILFRIDESKEIAYVARIVYGGRNYTELI